MHFQFNHIWGSHKHSLRSPPADRPPKRDLSLEIARYVALAGYVALVSVAIAAVLLLSVTWPLAPAGSLTAGLLYLVFSSPREKR